MERIMACIPPNPRRVGYIDPVHGLTYTPTLTHFNHKPTVINKCVRNTRD